MTFNRTKFFAAYRESFGVLKQLQVDGLEALLSFVEQDKEIKDIRWAAYMLATVKHECADTWQPITERGPKSYFNKYEPNTKLGKALGNKIPGDGLRFKGRGYCMITGLANYKRMKEELGLSGLDDLVIHPEVALRPDIAYKIMSAGMRRGMFTGQKLTDYIKGDDCDFRNARRIINGLDRASEIATYAVDLLGALRRAEE